jgi:hypothetical protein
VIHHCTECPALLETPTTLAGKSVSCPNCRKSLEVPMDVLVRERHPVSEIDWIAFPCPSCTVRLATDPKWAGALAVCVACQNPLRVPELAKRARPPRSIAAAIRTWEIPTEPPPRRCKSCRHPLPRQAINCGYCGLAGR